MSASVWGVVEPVKIILSSSLIAMQNSVAVCHTVRVHVGGEKNCGYRSPIGCRNTPHCYHTEFGRSMSNGMGVQKNSVDAGAQLPVQGYGLPRRNTSLPTCYQGKCGPSRQCSSRK